MILDVPYKSQLSIEDGDERKWCGLASLWMILAFWLKDSAPSGKELVEKYGAEFEQSNFSHAVLLKIAREFGLSGFRKSWHVLPGAQSIIDRFLEEGESEADINNWEETNIEEGIYTLHNFLNQGIPIIISMDKAYLYTDYTHLVVLVGSEKGDFIIHDPYKKGSNGKMFKEDFKAVWLKQALFIYPPEKVKAGVLRSPSEATTIW